MLTERGRRKSGSIKKINCKSIGKNSINVLLFQLGKLFHLKELYTNRNTTKKCRIKKSIFKIIYIRKRYRE
jgi:hypothetical protein